MPIFALSSSLTPRRIHVPSNKINYFNLKKILFLMFGMITVIIFYNLLLYNGQINHYRLCKKFIFAIFLV